MNYFRKMDEIIKLFLALNHQNNQFKMDNLTPLLIAALRHQNHFPFLANFVGAGGIMGEPLTEVGPAGSATSSRTESPERSEDEEEMEESSAKYLPSMQPEDLRLRIGYNYLYEKSGILIISFSKEGPLEEDETGCMAAPSNWPYEEQFKQV